MSNDTLFYSLTDDQLALVLHGAYDYDRFFGGEMGGKPAELLIVPASYATELAAILGPEGALGAYAIGLASWPRRYSYSTDAKLVLIEMRKLTELEICRRWDELETGQAFEDVYAAVKGVIEFYERAAAGWRGVVVTGMPCVSAARGVGEMAKAG